MNILELNQKEVSIVSGGLSVVDKYNLVGGVVGSFVTAYFLKRKYTAIQSSSHFEGSAKSERFEALVSHLFLGGVVAASGYVCSSVGHIIGHSIDRLFGWSDK